MTLKEKINKAWKIYGDWGLPFRLIIGACVTLVAGTGLGFFAEYAAYSWAIYYGVRPPLEGIPYLKLAVTGLTVFILLGGAITFVVIEFFANRILQWAELQLESLSITGKIEKVTKGGRELYQKVSLVTALAVSLAIAIAVPLIIYSIGISDNDSNKTQQLILAGIFSFVVMLLLWDKRVPRILALSGVTAFIIIIPFSFFNVNVYNYILRELGYGGGLPVQITIIGEATENSQRTNLDAYLMLRTTTSILIYESPAERIREIPLSQILFLDHKAIPIEKRTPKLPNPKN